MDGGTGVSGPGPGRELVEGRRFSLVFSMAAPLGPRTSPGIEGDVLECSLWGCVCVRELSRLDLNTHSLSNLFLVSPRLISNF